MLTVFDRPETSKELYFNLSNSLNLSHAMKSSTYKIAGLYAIYKDDICMYVGQSKNIPSRLSTHLTGRYESCDKVEVFYVCENNFSDFYERNATSQASILENNEKRLINILKPIENLMVDRDAQIKNECLFFVLECDDEYGREDMQILLNESSVTVTDSSFESVYALDTRVKDEYNSEMKLLGANNNA